MATLNFVHVQVLNGTDMQAGEWWTCGEELKGNSSLMPIMET